MGTLWKSTAPAIMLIALAVAGAPARAQDAGNDYSPQPDVDNGFGPPPGNSGYGNAPGAECNPANYGPAQAMPPECQPQAYCDQYGCPDDFYDMPIWYGPVFYDNVWFTGPVYYRSFHGRRQYWIQGSWHYDAWHGPHPSWWHAARYHVGPAVGRNNIQNHGVGNASAGVRVWRGTQSSTYYDSGSGSYFRRGVSDRAAAPPAAIAHGVSHFNAANVRASFAAQHQAQPIAPRRYYGGGRGFRGARGDSSHGHGR